MRCISRALGASLVLVVSAFSLGACATAQPLSTPMPEGEAVTAPIGLMAFCRRHPEQCARRAEAPTAAELDADAWTQLVD
ncbi:MAG: hypothetical protein AAGL49_05075, partial [Pseudomonadota bacterium]